MIANIGPLKSNDDKKSSLLSKMGGMIAAARRDGQTPKRWVVTLDFMGRMLEEMPLGIPATWHYPGIPEFMGIPVEVDHHQIHDCILDVE